MRTETDAEELTKIDLLAACGELVASAIPFNDFEYRIPQGILDRLKSAIEKANVEAP